MNKYEQILQIAMAEDMTPTAALRKIAALAAGALQTPTVAEEMKLPFTLLVKVNEIDGLVSDDVYAFDRTTGVRARLDAANVVVLDFGVEGDPDAAARLFDDLLYYGFEDEAERFRPEGYDPFYADADPAF